jgi:hypothetical protein
LYSRVDCEQKKSSAAVRLPHLNAGILVAGVEIFDYAFLFVSRHSSGWREESRTVAAPLNQLGHWIFLFFLSLFILVLSNTQQRKQRARKRWLGRR